MKLLDSLIRRRQGPDPRSGAGTAPAAEFGADDERAHAWCRQGDDLVRKGRAEEALQAYQCAIDLAAACVEGHVRQARAYRMLERNVDAADCLEVALALDASASRALQLLARIRADQGDHRGALELLERAVAGAPICAESRFQLALAQNRCGQTAAAMASYRELIERTPDDPAPRVNLGLIHLQQLAEPAEAEMMFRQALALAPRHNEATANLGLALHDQGRFEEAFELYRQGLATDPECRELRWNQTLARLSLGDYAQGWIDYDLRFDRPGGRRLERFAYPGWDGHPLAASRLLVLAEQGVGDEIMFASCLPDLQALTAGVVLECAPRLAALFARSFPAVSVHGRERHAPVAWLQDYPDIAAKIPIGSLPGLLRLSSAAFPAHAGYLAPDPIRVNALRERLNALGSEPKVGVSWRAGTRATRGELRSIDFDLLRPLLATPGVRFVSLQHGMTVAEREHAGACGMLHLDLDAEDLDADAALIGALDLVITVANTSAHLAGALGRPTWVLLNEAPEWRWLRAGERSPWYPSAQLLRSAGLPRWASVVNETRQRLQAWAVAAARSTTSGASA